MGYENDAEVGRTFEVVQEPFKTVEFGIPLEDVEKGEESKKLLWERVERVVSTSVKKEKVATAAESSLDGEFLRRLRSETAMMKTWKGLPRLLLIKLFLFGEVMSLHCLNLIFLCVETWIELEK